MANTDRTAHLTPLQRIELHRAQRAALGVGVIAPAVIVLVAVALMVIWLPRVPSPMATHWGSSGGPDGFMTPPVNLLVAVGTLTGTLALMALIVLLMRRPSDTAVWSTMHRLMPAFSLATMVFLSVVLVGTWQIQLDQTDATQVGSVDTLLLGALALTVLAAAIGWVLQPRVRIDPPPTAHAAPLDIDASSNAAWIASVKPGKLFLAIIVPSMVLMVCISVWLYAMQEPTWWVIGAITLVIILLLAATGAFHVSVTERGFEARSMLGWPVFRVAAHDVKRVVASDINPLAEFGGFGLRWAPGRVGLVYRQGEGIIITKTDGSIIAATVDDAATGASLLAAFAEMHHDDTRGEHA